MARRLMENWVDGGFLAGCLLLLLAPALTLHWSMGLLTIYLCLPAYMLHQFEEHDRDRFRLYVNANIGRGREVLTQLEIFVINIAGVWGLLAVSLTLAVFVNVGFGLVAAYLLLVNALMHITQGFANRDYNPGLDTAVILFLPLGIFSLEMIRRAGGGSLPMHALGLCTSLALHGAIVLYAARRLRRATA